MATQKLKTRIVQKHDLPSNWEKATSFIPMEGEIIVYDYPNDKKFKIGDGKTLVNSLPFIHLNWNEINGKPSNFTPSSHTHTKSEVGLNKVDNTADNEKSVKYAETAGSTKRALIDSNITQMVPDLNNYLSSPLSKYLYHDILGFCNRGIPIFKQRQKSDGKWVEKPCDKNLFAYKDGYRTTILTNIYDSAEWLWHNDSLAYCNASWLIIGITYSSPTPEYEIKLEGSQDGLKWNTCHQSTSSTNSTPIWLKVSGRPEPNKYFKLTISKVDKNVSGDVSISTIRLLSSRWGDQGGGSEFEYPYDWDGNKNIKCEGNIYSKGQKVVLDNDSRLIDSRPASDVYEWAKANTKPEYKANEIKFSDGKTFQQKLDSGELKGQPGEKGATGPQGTTGLQGPAGKTPIKGQDYFTTNEINTITSNAATQAVNKINLKASYEASTFTLALDV